MDSELKLTDIKFLRTVRDINTNQEQHEQTKQSEVPASTGAITAESGLSEGKVRYRMGGSQCRGLEEMGLTIIHEAEFNEETRTFGSKSIELTDKGLEELDEFGSDEIIDSDDEHDTPEVLKQLRARVNNLEERTGSGGSESTDIQREVDSIRTDIDRLEAKVDEIRENPWSGLDHDVVEHIKKTGQESQGMQYILETVFGIDVEQCIEAGSYPSTTAIETERAEISELLSEAEIENNTKASGGETRTKSVDGVHDPEPPESMRDDE